MKRTKYLFSILNGATPASGEPAFWDGEIPWATPEDLGKLPGSTLLSTRRNITTSGYQSCGTHLAPIGSIVMTTRAPVGNLALAGVALCTNQGCKTLVPHENRVDTRYFYYHLLTQTQELNIRATGTTFLELGTDELRDFLLFNPTLKDQQAIADFLDQETARLDALVSEKERWLELLAEKRRALITHAVTRGLNPAMPLRNSGVEWLGQVPAHWEVKKAKWLFKEIDERTTTGEEELLSLRMNVGLVRHNDVSEKQTRAEELIGFKLTEPDDIVVNKMRASSGLVSITPERGLVSPDYTVLRKFVELDCGYFVKLFGTSLMQAVFRSESKGLGTGASGFLRIYSDNLLGIKLPVPPLAEQRAIVAHISNATAKLDALRMATERTIALLKERRAALIAAAVTGQFKIHGEG